MFCKTRWLSLLTGSASLVGLAVLLAGVGCYFPWAGTVAILFLAVLTALHPPAGIALLFPLISIDSARPVLGGIYVSLSECEFAAVFMAWLANLALDPAKRGATRPIDWRPLRWGWPLVAAVLLSASVNSQWFRVLPHGIRASELMAACFLTANVYADRRHRVWWSAALMAGAALFSAGGVLEAGTPVFARSRAVFGNANQFAAYLNLLWPFSAVSCLACKGWKRALWGAISLMMLAAGVTAQSRAAALGGLTATLLVAIFYFQATRRPAENAPRRPGRRAYRPALAVLAGTALCAIAFWSFSPALQNYVTRSWTVLEGRTRLNSAAEFVGLRLLYWRLGLTIWRDHPMVGVGPGNYDSAAVQYRDLLERKIKGLNDRARFRVNSKIHVHNLFLQTAVSLGLIGLATFLYFLARVWIAAFRRRRDSLWAVASLGVLAAFFVQGLWDVTWPSLAFELGLVLGAALPAPSVGKESKPQAPSGSADRKA